MWSSIHHSETIFNHLRELKLCRVASHIAIGHILSILIAMFSRGYGVRRLILPCAVITIAPQLVTF